MRLKERHSITLTFMEIVASILKWMVILLAVISFGFMVVDGVRALVVGDYFRPTSGEHAGQLGPWTKLVTKIGIDPESKLMKSIFAILGTIGLALTIAYASGRLSTKGMIAVCLLGIWNLYVGTAISVLQITLLVILLVL